MISRKKLLIKRIVLYILAVVSLLLFTKAIVTFYEVSSVLKLFAYSMFFFIIFVLAFTMFFAEKVDFSIASFIIVLIFGIVVGLVNPPNIAPDEAFHLNNTYRYSNYLMLDNEENGLIPMRACDFMEENLLHDAEYITKSDYEKIFLGDFFVGEQEYLERKYTRIAPWYKYVFSTVGVTIGRLIHLNTWPMLFLGRFCNLLFYSFCVFLSVRLVPRGKLQVLTFSLMPFLLGQVSSFSYDAISNALAILFISMCFCYIEDKNKLKIPQFILLLFIFVWFIQFKGIYISFGLILLYVLYIKFRERIQQFYKKRKEIVFITSAVLIVMIVVALVLYFFKFGSTSFWGRNVYNGMETYALSDFETETSKMVIVLYNALCTVVSNMTLGNLSFAWIGGNAIASMGLIIANVILLVLAKNNTFNKTIRRLSLICIIISATLAIFGTLFAWTPTHVLNVWGMQPRYFLPLIALLLISHGDKVCLENGRLKYVVIMEFALGTNILNEFLVNYAR